MHYKYCPECGEKLIDKMAGDDGYVPYCNPCSKYWFDTFPSCVIILLANEYNEMVMLKQGYMSKEHWTYIAGYMKPGETAEESIVREVEEEVGLNVDELIYGGTYWHTRGGQLMHGFIGFCKKRDFVLSNEVDEAEWVPVESATERMFPERPGNTQYPLYRKYLEIVDNRK